MAEAAVKGHFRHGVAIVDDDVEIGQGGQCRAVQQGFATLPAAEQCALDAGAEYRLGDRVHGMSWVASHAK